MHQVVSEIVRFLQQGISAIFRFVEMVWNWTVDQVAKLVATPWHDWPLLKIILLAIVAVAVVWALYRVVWELWFATERILRAFAALLGTLVYTLPRVLMAGVIALGGVWIINHLDNAAMQIPTSLQVLLQPVPATPPAAPQPRAPAAQPAENH